MSSLTDIIFLLLIFFMLTSNFVQIKPFELPKSDSQTVAPTNITVQLENDETDVTLNNITIPESQVGRALGDALAQVKGNYSLLIAPDKKAPIELVVVVMDLARRYEINGVLAAEK